MIERFLAGPKARFDSFLQGLSGRERILLYAAAATSTILILWLMVYEPMTNTLYNLDRQIETARRDAGSVAGLVQRYQRLLQEVTLLESGSTDGAAGVSLFAELESTAVPIVGRERIVSMNPSSRPVGDRFEEDLVDMRLEGVPFRAIVELLYTIEYKDPPMRLSRAAFKREYKDPSLVDATLVVARLSPR